MLKPQQVTSHHNRGMVTPSMGLDVVTRLDGRMGLFSPSHMTVIALRLRFSIQHP